MRRDFVLVFGLACLAGCSGAPSETAEILTQAGGTWTADNCLDGQDMDAADVDIRNCPPLPAYPQPVTVGAAPISLGAWELGTTADGQTYKYGGLASPDGGSVVLVFEGGSAEVSADNVECWAKGYYRLRKILQDPPAEWLALRGAGFQFRFFQFQTDLRNGPTGYRRIASFQDHLVKWVTVISPAGVCQQPTLGAFRDYATSELARRGLDHGASDAGVSSDGGAP